MSESYGERRHNDFSFAQGDEITEEQRHVIEKLENGPKDDLAGSYEERVDQFGSVANETMFELDPSEMLVIPDMEGDKNLEMLLNKQRDAWQNNDPEEVERLEKMIAMHRDRTERK